MTEKDLIKNNNEAVEVKEKVNGKFAINILPITNKEDKLSYITNLSILNGVTQDDMKKFKCMNHGNGSFLNKNTPSKFLARELKSNGYDTDGWVGIDKIINSGYRLFQAKNIKIKNNIVVVTTTDNQKYAGIFDEFLQKGVSGIEHKTDFEISTLRGNIKQERKMFLDNNLLSIKSDRLLNIGADGYCETNTDKNEFCVLDKNKIATYIYSKDSIDRQSDYFDLSVYGDIKNIKTDENNNFYFIICEKDGKSELKVLNRKTLGEIVSFKNLTVMVYMSNQTNKLLCTDKNDFLRVITINVKNLPRGYVDSNDITAESEKENVIKIEDKGRSDLKNVLSGGLDIDIDTLQSGEGWVDEESMSDNEIRKQIRKLTFSEFEDKTLQQLFKEANNIKKINIVGGIIQQIKRKPEVMAVKGIIDLIESKIIQKRNEIQLVDMFDQIDELSKSLKNSDDDFVTLISLKTKLGNLRATRAQIALPPTEQDKELKELIKLTDEKIIDYQKQHEKEIISEVEENLIKIEEYLMDIDYLTGITSIYSTDIWKQTDVMINYLEKNKKKELKNKMKDLVKKKQQKLSNIEQGKHKSKQQEVEENVQELKTSLNQIKSIVESINDKNTLSGMELSDPLVLEIKQKADDLPVNKGQEIILKLENIFKERLISVEFNKEQSQGSIKSLDQYGISKSLYFVPDVMKKVKWDIVGKPNKDGKFKLLFQSSVGNEIEPSINKKILGNFKFIYTFDERQKLKKTIGERRSNGIKKEFSDLKSDLISMKKVDGYQKDEKYIEKLNRFENLEKTYYVARMLEVMTKISGENNMWNVSSRPNLPSLDNKTVIGETIQASLSKRGRLLDQQQQYKQGIMIVESEAGTGKNFKVDILGHLTNREVFDISCNEYMEKEDLLFSPEINSEGTFRTPSNLVKGLQTPGAIIVLDEINTLKPGVSKLLNPLLDNRRYINDPQLGRIHAHPSVVIIGLMNPRYYRGTQDLPQEFISRGRFTDDQYPGKIEEAYMNSKYLNNSVGRLTQQEFDSYREKYIKLQEVPNDKSIYNVFVALEKVTQVANKIRDVYSKTMKNDVGYDEELDFVFTIRDGNYVLQDFNYSQDIKKSLEDVILPKIADYKHKEVAQGIIDEICE